MDHQTAAPPPQSIPTTTATTTTTAATYPDSLDSSPRSRNTDSWGDDTINTTTNNHQNATIQQPPPPQQLTKLRLMCSYGGHIVPRPHDKSLCYVGGDTRIVVVDRHTTLSDLTNRLSKTLLRSSSNNSLSSSVSISISTPQTTSFTLKYQLPSEDLDSLISVTTDEDLENMIDEYERLLSNNSSSRLRLFLFPLKPESVTSIGSLLENTAKSEDWFLNALNGTTSGFSDTSSVNCLLGLDDDVLVNDKKDVKKGNINQINQNNNNGSNNNLGQDVHSVADLERTSSFGSASSSPSLASLPPIKVHVDESKGGTGIEEQFVQMNLQQQQQSVAVPVAPVVVTGVPMSTNSPLAQTGYDLASQESVLSDGRQKPGMIYQDQLVQMQVNNSNNNNRNAEMNNLQDQNVRIQMQQQQQQQQQQMADSAYLMSMGNTQQVGDSQQHTQMLHQQPQFIHTGVPQPQYIHHHQHPSGAVPMTSYYQMYPPQSQHHPHHAPIDQQNFVYYMPAPARQAPHGYNVQMHQQQQQQQQQQGSGGYVEVSNAGATPLSHSQAPQTGYTTNRPAQTGTKSELPAGVYGTTTSGNPQFVQVPSSQHQQPQVQPQYVGYSQMHHPSQSVASSASGASAGANYGYEFTDPAQGQHIYYAAQPLPPQSAAQYQTVTGEPGSYLPTDTSTKQQQQQGRGQQP